MKVNLLQSCWQQFNVHYYDKMKSVFNNNRDEALWYLQEASIETVPKDIENYMFVNQITGNKYSTKSEVVQQSLASVIDEMEYLNGQLED